jgi:hypothetical protein
MRPWQILEEIYQHYVSPVIIRGKALKATPIGALKTPQGLGFRVMVSTIVAR